GALLAALALSVLLIAVVGGLFSAWQTYFTASVGEKVMAAIRRQLYTHIQRLSHSFYDTHHSGDLLMRLTGDISLLRELMVSLVLELSDRFLVLVGMVAIMAWMDWRLTLVAAGILPIILVAVLYFSGAIRSATKQQRRKDGHMASALGERLAAIRV